MVALFLFLALSVVSLFAYTKKCGDTKTSRSEMTREKLANNHVIGSFKSASSTAIRVLLE